jgi:hypothetical protein
MANMLGVTVEAIRQSEAVSKRNLIRKEKRNGGIVEKI